MNLKFNNSEGDMVLSKNFILSISSYKRRVGMQKRYGKDGAVPTGDQMVDSRDLSLAYQPVSDNDTDYLDAVNEIIGFFRTDLTPFYLIDIDNNKRTEIILKSATDEADAEGLEYRVGKNKLEFEMVDGHWEDEDETVVYSPTGGLADGDSIIINIPSYVECYPIIKISPTETNTDFTIRNLLTGAAFVLGSASFVVGTEFIIDSQLGTIYLDDGTTMTEMSSALADGSGFIKLIPGNNEIQYSSAFGEVDVEISYRERYAI
jgi:phage-related protein